MISKALLTLLVAGLVSASNPQLQKFLQQTEDVNEADRTAEIEYLKERIDQLAKDNADLDDEINQAKSKFESQKHQQLNDFEAYAEQARDDLDGQLERVKAEVDETIAEEENILEAEITQKKSQIDDNLDLMKAFEEHVQDTANEEIDEQENDRAHHNNEVYEVEAKTDDLHEELTDSKAREEDIGAQESDGKTEDAAPVFE
jgi:chromosome segregation ATPase